MCLHAWKWRPTQAGCWLTSPSRLKEMGLWAPPGGRGSRVSGASSQLWPIPTQLAFEWPRPRPTAGGQCLVHTGWTGGGPLVPAKWLKPHPPHPTPGWDLSGAAGGGRCSPHPPLTGGLTSGLTSGLGSGLPGIPGRRFRHRWPVPGSCKRRARRPAPVGGWPDTRQTAAGRPTRWL